MSHLWRFRASSGIVESVTPFLLAAALALGGSASAAEGRYRETSPQLAHQQASEGGQAIPNPTTIPEMWGAWCARCHAEDGSGKVNQPTITVEPMDFTECKVTTPEPDADWERAVAKGGPGVGLSPEMPGFEDSLTRDQIAGFVAHMRGFCKETGWPSGNTNFPRPIITEKAFPENEFVILPAINHQRKRLAPSLTDVSFVGVYERRIGKRSMVEFAVPVVSNDDSVSRVSGIGDLAVAFKHAVYASSSAPRIVSLGLEAVIPSGNHDEGLGHGTVIFEPFITAGALLREWYVQAQFKTEWPVNTDRADRVLVYNVYAGRDTSAAPNTWTLGVEFNGENRELALTPQLRKGLTGTGALAASVGVMLPLNERHERGVRWVGYLLWEFLEPLRARR